MPPIDDETPATRPVDRVREELRRYEHMLAVFDAAEKEDGSVELLIRLKDPREDVHVYRAPIHPRDIESSQFTWSFQRLLYDCLHEYLLELFTKTPQSQDSTS